MKPVESVDEVKFHVSDFGIFIFDSDKTDPSGKQQTRNQRRRDFPSNSAQTQKNDRSNHCNSNYQYKQQQQQQQPHQPHIFAPKPRGNDNKQHRNTGRPNGCASDEYPPATASHGARLTRPYDDDGTDSIGNDYEVELNSVYLPGSKKQNLNHLLNFNYAPRDRNDPINYQRTGNNAKGARFTKHAKYNKEQYLQAK